MHNTIEIMPYIDLLSSTILHWMLIIMCDLSFNMIFFFCELKVSELIFLVKGIKIFQYFNALSLYYVL